MMRWLKNLFKKKKREPNYLDGEYLVQDWRGFVISQEEHRRMWDFEGYPATHATDCTCIRCQMATTNYRIDTGCDVVVGYNPTRRQVFDYLNRQTFDYPWIKKEDFLPKKKMKVHKLDQHIRKETFVGPGVYAREVGFSPGVYTRELDVSVWVPVRGNRDE